MSRHSTAKLLLALVAACTLAPRPIEATPGSTALQSASTTAPMRIIGAA
ncbi:MAG: hypothetical protein GY704_06945, partial [Phycisphaeraceae bacterium]|nr:hypothetical protein [Phycisphaeraceae bacterium]